MPNLKEVREQLFATYACQNFWHFGASPMASEIHRRASGLLEARRKSNWVFYKKIIVDLFAWITNFLSDLGINVEDELTKHYPGCCPYCLQKPCACNISSKGQRRMPLEFPELSTLTLNEWQKLFREIYPNKGMGDEFATDKVVEEIAEMDTATRDLNFDACVEEAIDAITRIFAVANQQEFSIEETLRARYPNGLCCACRQSPCQCSYKEVLFSYRPRT